MSLDFLKNSSAINLLPQDIQQSMIDYIGSMVIEIPEYNIVETVSEWAERKRSIGKGLTANPGPFEFSITPYLREIADCLSDNSPIIESYVIKATQVGFTVGVMENHMGYCIDYGLGPLLYISGDQAMAEEQFEKRIDEMVHSANLQEKIKPNIVKKKGKSTGDRMDSKSYGGTFMRAVGPNSESKLRSFPQRYLHEDEIDIYPQKIVKNGMSTGDTLKKAERRADSYGLLKKIMGGSTPKEESTSRIAKKVEEGDKRYYNIICPDCGFQHPQIWANFKWEKDSEGKPDFRYKTINGVEVISKDPTYFECPECKYKIREKEKSKILLEKGYGGTAEWIPTKKPDRPFVRSYVIPGWLGFRSWLEIALEFVQVKDDPFLFPDFVNDVMGETWSDSKEKPNEHFLMDIAQEYEIWPRGFIKKEVLFLTIAADIQKDRIEAGIMGWGRNKQGYMIDYWTFPGDPSMVEDKSWKNLSEKILAKYIREDGVELNVTIAFVDSQFLSDTVDLFCDSFPYDETTVAGVFPIQSRESQNKLVKKSKSNIKTPVVCIHDQEIKRGLYNLLRKRPHSLSSFPSYYLHFSHEYGPEFYKQLTAEEIVLIKIKGSIKGFKIINTKQRRNEVLDVVKMNMAALQFGIDLFFEILNDDLKSQKRNQIQEDSILFFDEIENALYS